MAQPYEPFKHMYCIDLLQPDERGGIDLYIVAHNPLLPTEEVMDQLKRKVRFYLAEIDTLGFQAVWKHPPPELTNIIIATTDELHSTVSSFVDSLRTVVENGNARLKKRVFESGYPEWLVDKVPLALSVDEVTESEIQDLLQRMQYKLAKGGLLAAVYPSSYSITCAPCHAPAELRDDGPYCPGPYVMEFANVFVPVHADTCQIQFDTIKSQWDVDISQVMAPGPGNVYLRGAYPTVEAVVEAVLDCYSVNR